MSISRAVGERLRTYRKQKGWSQEFLAERADLHPTYIGQLERGEKNATLDTISKVAQALDISLSQLFENIPMENKQDDIPSKCYALVQQRPLEEQKYLLEILYTALAYRDC